MINVEILSYPAAHTVAEQNMTPQLKDPDFLRIVSMRQAASDACYAITGVDSNLFLDSPEMTIGTAAVILHLLKRIEALEEKVALG